MDRKWKKWGTWQIGHEVDGPELVKECEGGKPAFIQVSKAAIHLLSGKGWEAGWRPKTTAQQFKHQSISVTCSHYRTHSLIGCRCPPSSIWSDMTLVFSGWVGSMWLWHFTLLTCQPQKRPESTASRRLQTAPTVYRNTGNEGPGSDSRTAALQWCLLKLGESAKGENLRAARAGRQSQHVKCFSFHWTL